MQTTKTLTLVQNNSGSVPTDFYDEDEMSQRLREIEAAAHQWQVRKMSEWLAKPIGRKVTPGDEVHRVICAIQIIREQVPAYSINRLATESQIPRSTLKERLKGNSVLTVKDVFLIARAMDVSAVDIFQLSAKGTK